MHIPTDPPFRNKSTTKNHPALYPKNLNMMIKKPKDRLQEYNIYISYYSKFKVSKCRFQTEHK